MGLNYKLNTKKLFFCKILLTTQCVNHKLIKSLEAHHKVVSCMCLIHKNVLIH